jgi:hypothetical protein
MRLLQIGIALAVATAGFGDTITFKNGQVVNGTFFGRHGPPGASRLGRPGPDL